MALELCRRNLASIEKAKAIITIKRRKIFHFRSIEHSFTNNQLNKQKALEPVLLTLVWQTLGRGH